MRAFPVRLPSGARYWTVLDEDLAVVAVADGFLRQVRFGRDGAESTTKSYAHSIALFLRWYDAVVLGSDTESVRLWEPAHGEVAAQRRRPQQQYDPGTRAYLSAGLPGAKGWVAGKAMDQAEDAEVELDEVERLYTEHDMWNSAFG